MGRDLDGRCLIGIGRVWIAISSWPSADSFQASMGLAATNGRTVDTPPAERALSTLVGKAWYANSRSAWLNRSRPILRLATPIRTAIRILRRRSCWPLQRAQAPEPFTWGQLATLAELSRVAAVSMPVARIVHRVCYIAEVKDLVAATKDAAEAASAAQEGLKLPRHRTTRSSSDSGARSLQRKESLIAAPIRWPCCRIAEALRAVGGGSSWRRYPRRRTAVTATAALTEPSIHRRPPARRRSSEARKTMPLAMSSGTPSRPIGCLDMAC